MEEIEIKNKINFRNIAIFFVIGIAGVLNGTRDFSIYQIPISKFIFPDPVTYQNVVVMNQTMMSTLNVQNSMSFASLGVTLFIFIVLATMIIGMTAGMLGRGD